MSGILSNLFNSISSKFSEKQFFNSTYRWVGNSGATWVDTAVPRKLFYEIPELNQVVNKKADMFVNGVFKVVDNEGVEIDSPYATNLLDLLKKPNVLQSQNQWMRQYMQQFSIYGEQFLVKNKVTSLSDLPSSLMNSSPAYTSAILTGKLFEQVDMGGIVKHYAYEKNGAKKELEVSKVMWTKNDDIDDSTNGISPLKSLKFPLSNTKLAYQYLNVISGEKGAIGLISTTPDKDSMGAIPMTAEDKKALNDKFTTENGVKDGQSRVIQVDGSVKWQPMTYETGKLLLLEQIEANKLTIVDHYGLNVNLFSSKSQTFENVKNAIKQVYSDAIFPFADAFSQSLTTFLELPKNHHIELDYSHIAILQEDLGTQAEVLKKQLDSVSQAISTELITPQQGAVIIENSFGLAI